MQEGQVLVRLDAAKVYSETEIIERRLIDLTAERARLEAERADRDVIVAPAPPVSSDKAMLTLRLALSAQQNMLVERRSTKANQLRPARRAQDTVREPDQGPGRPAQGHER